MTILLIEDERRAANVLRELIDSTGSHQILGIFESVERTVSYLKTASPQPDLIFLDVQLADGNGFEIFKRVAVQSAIVVCSSIERHDYPAPAADIIGHVLKPVNPADLTRVLAQAEHYLGVA